MTEPSDKSIEFLPDAPPEVSVVADAKELKVAPVQLHVPGSGGPACPLHLLGVRDLGDQPTHWCGHGDNNRPLVLGPASNLEHFIKNEKYL